MRVLGVDHGRSRTGLALSDPLGLTCRPLEVVKERNEDRLILRIMAVAAEEGAEEIVVGLPRPLGGGTNPQMEEVLAFAGRLKCRSAVPVQLWDERFTSKLAAKGGSRGHFHDAVAACYMLQNYLDSRTTTVGGA